MLYVLLNGEPIALVVSLLPVDGAIDENHLSVDEHEKKSLASKETVMARIYQLLIVIGTIAATSLLIGCGQPAPTGTTSPFTATTTPSVKATNASTSIASSRPVTLQVAAQTYLSKDTITITLHNQSNQTIYFPDHLTNCSIILLLRLNVQPVASDSGPSAASPCRAEIATRIHSLAAKQDIAVRLMAPATGWLPGIYHAVLSYSSSPALSTPTTIRSTAFTVGPFTPQP